MSSPESSTPADSPYVELIVVVRSSRQSYRVRSDSKLKRLFDVCMERHPFLRNTRRLNFTFNDTVLRPEDTPKALGLYSKSVILALENGDSG